MARSCRLPRSRQPPANAPFALCPIRKLLAAVTEPAIPKEVLAINSEISPAKEEMQV